ncbi:uncharacterized protein LOC135489212 isoform X2 [Lineus longissimus]|uniref:uncharacterized protein LOC135489212 isoform X2 n=1 Tax=Lineus longissimus TaxID=88925 RepID=UPI00315D47F7
MMKRGAKMEVIYIVFICYLLQAFVASDETDCGWGVCSQGCHAVRGTKVNCTCNEGFSRESDNFTCKSNDGRNPFLIFSRRHEILRLDMKTRVNVALVSGLRNTVALDLHYKKQMLFWTDQPGMTNRISSGTIVSDTLINIKPVISVGLANVEGVAVDWIGNNIYWVDNDHDRIEVARLNGTMRTTFVEGNVASPRAIVLDPRWGLLFWSDWEATRPRIERVSMSGEGRKIIYDIRRIPGAAWPNGMTLDYENVRLYWIDAKSDSLHTVNYEGGDHRIVLRDEQHLTHPFAITTFGNNVYWTDWTTNSITKANKWNGTNVEIVSRTTTQPFGVLVSHSSRQPDSPNPCEPPRNGGCSHLCLINSDPQLANMEYKTRAGCACPHPMILKADKKTCGSNEIGPPRNIRVVFIHHDPPFGTVTWDAPADASGPIDYYWMRFGEKGQTHLEERQLAGRTPFTAIYAENGMEYEIRVAADIDGRRGEYAIMTVVAPDGRPTASPENLTVTGLSPTSVHVTWDPPLKRGRKGKIVNYMVEWRKESGETLWTSNLNTSETDVTIGDRTPLKPETYYVFRVRAFTSAGSGPLTQTFRFTTDKAVGPPRNLRVVFIDHDPPFGTVTWDAPADTSGSIDYYWMRFGEKGQTHLEERQLAGRTPFTAIYADNGIEYEIRVAAEIDDERGEYAIKTVKAPDGRPSAPPQNVAVMGQSPTSVRLVWEPPAKAYRGGTILNYMVEWGTDEMIYKNKMNTSNTAVTVGDSQPLDPDTAYVFRVRAFTSAGSGPTETVQFKTDKDVATGRYGDVPSVLLNCTMTRKDDARVLAPNWETHPEITTEEECAANCLEVPMCDSVTFTNSSKKCEIHPRREFKFGYISEEGTSVMYEKDCPSIRDFADDPLPHQVICPLNRGAPKPSNKYAYRLRRYRSTYEDGEYACRRDEICAGLSYELNPRNNQFDFTFYYDATPDEGAPVSNMSAVKNCQPTSPNCGFLDAYYKKSFRNGWMYSTPTLRRGADKATLGDCLALCEKDSRCYAVTMIDYFEQFDCKLYGSPPRGGYRLMTYPGLGEVWTWMKTPGLCTQGMGGSDIPA